MTAADPAAGTVPDELRPLLDAYRTAELLTMTRSGDPIAWPTVSVYDPDAGTLVVTTSIALPQKAANIRRDPRVAMLFSDATASGLDRPQQVLVQGTATCPDEIVTSATPNLAFWERIYARQPSSRSYSANPVSRRLADWYYMRLVITVTPAAVRTRPAADGGGPIAVPAPPHGSTGPYAEAARRMPEFTSAVLAAFDGDGRPTLVRVRPAPGPAAGTFALPLPAGESLREGRASLLCHSHDEQLWNLRSFVVVGELAGPDGDAWRFTPTRFVPGAQRLGPVGGVQAVRAMRATARRYLATRGLPRPAVPWEEYHEIKARIARRG